MSIHEATPMFEFHHSPQIFNPRGVSEVNSDTVYRLASMTKLFTILGLLRTEKVSLEDPITKYLPELRDIHKEAAAQDAIRVVDWDSITLEALAAHQSGIGADCDWTAKGFLPADNKTRLQCSGFFGQRPCNRKDFFEHFGKRPPVHAPFETPIYSNIGTTLLGLVIETVTNQTYEDWIQHTIIDPIKMNRTFLSNPADSLGFIPINATDWPVELGVEAPTGAIYSTTSDLMAFGKAILSYEMLSPIRTRKWMKPLASTSSISTLIGAPWEVYRSNKVTKDGRLIEFYTKAGDLFTYHSVIALIPDYDLVMVALMGGPEVSGDTTYHVIGDASTALLPVIEQAGKAKAQAQYVGTYTDALTNSTLTLSLDDSPGFRVTKWQVRGVDVIGTSLLGDSPAVPPRVRLYPSDLSTSNQTAWRAVFGGSANDVAAEDALYPWDQFSCSSWASLDKLIYQFQGQDLFVFDMIEEEGGVLV
ncbi:hypothetical protein TRIATDRAFT_293745 [Trichoderma atroviride IMI 206040]|uniref:Uncharacterized protein n=1 Tax=Hypocrea atroviridis (strain ATCC 20476 / IMI 206040) TaxID=452589 RepID=G9NZ33_HYPAI|nr:uncharacterized protein TRIATDRAFT_293745 [Trichoderma atroviride IMI 206040]EHK44584.1 hypothetical protein TRIATDRAFT_293745 [Trichoderma atroviride IMI 206040]